MSGYIDDSFSKRGRGRPPLSQEGTRKCITPDCKGKHLAKGLCRRCYDSQPDRVKKRNAWLQKQPIEIRRNIAKRAYEKIKQDPKRHEKLKKNIRKYSKKYTKDQRYKDKRREYAKKRFDSMTPEERKARAKKYYLRMRNDPVRWKQQKARMREYNKKHKKISKSSPKKS